MKNIIKIILIAFAVAGIGVAIFFFCHNIDNGKEEVIATSNFEKTIQTRVSNEITGKPYNEATTGYDAIISSIKTEASITLGDGTANLSREEQQKCEKMAFYAYAPIFTQYATQYFHHSTWNESEMELLKSKSNYLLSANIAESGTDVARSLNSVVANINDYYAAKSLIASAKHCTSASAVDNIRNKVGNYKRPPLTNNTSLASGLNNAPNEAKNSYGQYVIHQCNSIASRYRSYGSYPAWYSEYERAYNLIKEYTNKYGSEGMFSAVQSSLESSDRNAMDYYGE